MRYQGVEMPESGFDNLEAKRHNVGVERQPPKWLT